MVSDMFKKLGLIIFLVAYAFVSHAEKPPAFPDKLSIKKIKNCNSCVELKEHGQIFASLRPDAQKKDVFYFLNADNERQLTLKHTENKRYQAGDSVFAISYFDVFDKNNVLLAKLSFTSDTEGFAFLYFHILTPDKISTLITGNENFFGTNTTLYDTRFNKWHIIGKLTKPLFTYSLDAELQITDKQELSYFMNPNVFFATLAINSNDDFFYSIDVSSYSKKRSKVINTENLYKLRKKILDLAESRDITLSQYPSDLSAEEIQAAGQVVSQRYQEMYGEDFWDKENLDKDKKLHQLINLGCDMIWSLNMSAQEEYATLQFLIRQLDKDSLEKL